MAYITVYEGSRQWLHNHNVESRKLKSFIAGGCASTASQVFVVPLDIVTQHMMLLGNTKTEGHPIKPGRTHLNTLNIDTASGSR